jgi:peptidyl-prolyl cis-trans isomerase C
MPTMVRRTFWSHPSVALSRLLLLPEEISTMSKLMACGVAVVAIAALSVSVWAQAPSVPAPPPALQVKPPAPAEKVVALVGDEKITNTELEGMVGSQLRGRPVPPEAMAGIRKSILESMIQNLLVIEYVAAKGVKVEATEVEETIATIKKQLADAGIEMATVLQSQGLTAETMKERIASELAVEKYAKAEVTEQKAEVYFNAHKAEFYEPKVKASHILIKFDPQGPAEEKKAANEKIAAIRQQIVGGADFGEAARQHSACPSKEQGGDLGFFAHDQMVKPFADAAFGLAPGDISQPVETQFGVHLIKVTEIDPGERKFDEAKDVVMGTLFQQLLEKAAEEQRKVTKVEILN